MSLRRPLVDPGTTGGELAARVAIEGPYEILEEIGVGSFGEVYKARQRSTGQLVAVKLLRHVSNNRYGNHVQRFRREARMGAGLSHPNIVRLIDSGEETDGRLYAVFEFVPGTTLRSVLANEGKLEASEAVHLMSQVLDAMTCAHAAGIVHRDLKPENIMITKTGARRNALVLDFGLGGITVDPKESRERITETHDILGTPCYAAPEQLRGEPASPASDLYSWGLILLECLTGEMPIQGASPQEVIERQLGPDPVPIPPALRDRPLGRVLEVLTAKRASERTLEPEAILRILAGVATPVDAASNEAATAVPAVGTKERRRLTILCCELVIAESGADVEEFEEILVTERARLGEWAEREGGVTTRLVGNRMFAVFGHPQAYEDDGRRAARLARRLVGESHAKGPRGAGVRIGMHSGSVLVPTRDRSGGATLDPSGPAFEIAGRLAERADAGGVLISSDFRRVVEREADCESAGELVLSRESKPIHVFRLLGLRSAADDSLGSRWETPLVGRAAPLQQLSDLWTRAAAGQPAVVVVSGEAGIGKSRLLRELRRRVGDGTWIDWRCAVESRSAALRPIVEALSSMDLPIEMLLDQAGVDVREAMPLFADLLSLPHDDRYPPSPLTPERQKELTLQAITNLVLGTAENDPVVLAVENLHWADPTTLELLALLAEEVRGSRYEGSGTGPRLLVILTARPEGVPSWSTEAVALLPLQRLTHEEMGEMAAAVLGGASCTSSPVVDLLARRGEGIPLFVEEILRLVAETGGSGSPSARESPVQIPDSLRGLLGARLDAVSASARQTAQLAAALGREFRSDVLEAIVSKEPALFRRDIDELNEGGLVFRRRGGRGDLFFFRHALLRDAAYEAMTRPVRKEAHGRIAKLLLEKFPEIEQGRPDMVAYHCEEGGEPEAAVDYWLRAGNASYRRAAYAEASSQYEHGLQLVRSLESSPANVRREIYLLVATGTIFFSTRGWSVPEVEETFERAWKLSKELETGTPQSVLYGIWAVNVTRSDRKQIEALLPDLRVLAAQTDHPASALFGQSCLGCAAFWRGDFATALQHLAEACRNHESGLGGTVYDGGLYAYAFHLLTLWLMGFPDQAKEVWTKLWREAERRRDPYSLCIALTNGAILASDIGDLETAKEYASRIVTVAEEQKVYAWWPTGKIQYGHSLNLGGQPEEAIHAIRQGLERLRVLGVMGTYCYYTPTLARALLDAGRLDEAEAAIEEGLDLCQTLLARCIEPELLRLRGLVRLKEGDQSGAEESLHAALAMAERDGALAYALRAATDLCRFLIGTGRSGDGRVALRSVYDRFSEGFETRDLKDAGALLDMTGA